MEKPKFPSDEAAKFMIRLSKELRDHLAEAAQRAGRSMNSEVVARLQDSFATRQSDQVLDAGQFLLASFLRRMYDDLPKSKQAEGHHRLANQLASAILHKDTAAMAQAFAGLFAGDAQVVATMEELKREHSPGGRFEDVEKRR